MLGISRWFVLYAHNTVKRDYRYGISQLHVTNLIQRKYTVYSIGDIGEAS